MPRHRLLVALSAMLGAVVLAGCAARFDVSAAALPGADLAAYRTFALDASTAPPAVWDSLRAGLEQRGYVHDAQDPDLRVALAFEVAEQSRAPASATGSRMGATKKRRGELVVSIKDARTAAVIWRGTAAGGLDADSLAEPDTAGAVAQRLLAAMASPAGGAAQEGSPAP